MSERLKLVWNVSESQIKKERSTAAAKSSSLFNLLIPEASALAFAGVPLWAWLTGSSGLVVGGGGLWWSRKMSEPARNLKQVIQEYQSRSGFEVVNVEFESNKLTSSGGSQTTFCEISRSGAFDVELNKASIILHEKRRVEDKLVVLPVTYVFSYELDEVNRIKKDARGEPVIVTEVIYPEEKKILEYSLVDRSYRELKMDRYLREQIQSMRSEAVANSDKRIEGLRQATLRCCKAGNCPDSVASEFQKEEYIRPSGSSRAVN